MMDLRGAPWLLLAGLISLPASSAPVHAQSWRTVTEARQISGERKIHVKLSYGAGNLTLRPAETKGQLYRVRLRYDEERFRPVIGYDDARLELGVEGLDHDIRVGGEGRGGEMDVALATGLPMDLDLEFGAVRADVDLGGLSMTDLDLQTGASESHLDVSRPNPLAMRKADLQVGAADFTALHLGNLNADRIDVSAGVGEVTLELTGNWQRNATLSVDMGLGSLELRFPRGLGVKLLKSSFLTSLDPQGLVKRGDAFYSENWEEADRRLTVDIDAAFGSIRVVWVH